MYTAAAVIDASTGELIGNPHQYPQERDWTDVPIPLGGIESTLDLRVNNRDVVVARMTVQGEDRQQVLKAYSERLAQLRAQIDQTGPLTIHDNTPPDVL